MAREHGAAVSHRGYLFVAGGRRDYLFNSELRSVERYDPRRRRWQRCADMLQARCAAGVSGLMRVLRFFVLILITWLTAGLCWRFPLYCGRRVFGNTHQYGGAL